MPDDIGVVRRCYLCEQYKPCKFSNEAIPVCERCERDNKLKELERVPCLIKPEKTDKITSRN